MKRTIIITFLIFTLLYLSNVKSQVEQPAPAGYFCCNSTIPDQKKCYSTGECCLIGEKDEYWDPIGCYDFKIWLEPERAAFVTGKKTPINLYIENTGVYTDNYQISYTVNPSHLALVDITGISYVKNVGSGEIRLVKPRITVIAWRTPGYVDFTVTSDSGSSKIKRLTILESELPVSLPEFGFYGMTGMIILAGIIYFLIKRKH